ncbi:MAG: hypothetical protein R3C02_03695 [Planctomycetaceae bacterium]
MTAQWTLHGLVVFGMDGSRIDLPRTKSHEQASAPSRTPSRRTKTARGKRRASRPVRNTPAVILNSGWTTLFHVSLHLPWNWRIGPADSSERSHVLDMLETLPDASLLLGDAFVGYDFAQTAFDRGRGLLVRVGANVTLWKQLGYVRESTKPSLCGPIRRPPAVIRRSYFAMWLFRDHGTRFI